MAETHPEKVEPLATRYDGRAYIPKSDQQRRDGLQPGRPGGAAAAEGVSLAVEFRTRAEADRFAALYGRVVGMAAVKVFCAD